MDKIVFHNTPAGIKFIFRAGYFVHQLIRNGLLIFKHSRTYGGSISYDTYCARTNLMDIVSLDNTTVDVAAKKNGVTAQTGKFAILDAATLRIFYKNGCSPINSPVTAQQRLIVRHESTGGLAKANSSYRHVTGPVIFNPFNLNQTWDLSYFKYLIIYIFIWIWIVVQISGFSIQKPLAWCIKLLVYIFHKPVFVMHIGRTVILISALKKNTFVVFSCNYIMHIPPVPGMQRMDKTASGRFPSLYTGRCKRIGSRSIEDSAFFKVGVTGKNPFFSAHKQLLRLKQPVRYYKLTA